LSSGRRGSRRGKAELFSAVAPEASGNRIPDWNDPDATGFALARGMWRRHGWKMDGDRIIETTAGVQEEYGILFDDGYTSGVCNDHGSLPVILVPWLFSKQRDSRNPAQIDRIFGVP
jgi:hypothetical protein